MERKGIIILIFSGLSLLLSFTKLIPVPIDPAWIAIALCGFPMIKGAAIGLFTRFDIRAGVLVSIALIACIVTGDIFAAGEISFIMQIGEMLEDMTVAKARAGIERLVSLSPPTARVIRDGVEGIISAEDVKINDLLRVLPGETIAADGIIKKGETCVDQSIMTGESILVDKKEGDEVSGGTVNQFGAFDMIATKAGKDSSLQRMIRLVKSTDAGKAKIVRVADKWATWIVFIALSAAIGTWLVTGEVIRAVTILVVFCPCALVLATPTAIVAAIGNATKYGVLVREGDGLERLAAIEYIAFDKTGTLTYGKPEVIRVKSINDKLSDDELYRIIASAELKSEHPLGKSIVSGFKRIGEGFPEEPEDFKMLPGKGVYARVGSLNVLAGNEELLKENDIIVEDKSHEEDKAEGAGIIHIGIDGEYVGFIALSDSLRDISKNMIAQVKELGVIPMLLTGDHKESAAYIAGEVGIKEYRYDCLPENKLEIIDEFQKNGKRFCMVGDGVNDAPALKKSYVGIAMGGVGSDIAVEAADMVFVSDEIANLPHILSLSKKTMLTIKLNMAFAMILNVVATIMGMMGVINPVMGALVHNVGSVLVIINSGLLMNYKYK